MVWGVVGLGAGSLVTFLPALLLSMDRARPSDRLGSRRFIGDRGRPCFLGVRFLLSRLITEDSVFFQVGDEVQKSDEVRQEYEEQVRANSGVMGEVIQNNPDVYRSANERAVHDGEELLDIYDEIDGRQAVRTRDLAPYRSHKYPGSTSHPPAGCGLPPAPPPGYNLPSPPPTSLSASTPHPNAYRPTPTPAA